MKNIKVNIMTNKSYPKWKVKNYSISVDENNKSYYWEYKDLEIAFKSSNDEHPVILEINYIKVNA